MISPDPAFFRVVVLGIIADKHATVKALLGVVRHPDRLSQSRAGARLNCGPSCVGQSVAQKRQNSRACDNLPPRVRSQNLGSFACQPGSFVDSSGSNVDSVGSFVGFSAEMRRYMRH